MKYHSFTLVELLSAMAILVLVGTASAAALYAYKAAVKTVDESVKKGILHKNNAAHKKSSLTQKLNNLG